MTDKKTRNIFWVIASCIGASYLIFYGLQEVIGIFRNYDDSFSFDGFLYFLKNLYPFAMLFLGISLFVLIIRDLSPIKQNVLWITLIFSGIVFFFKSWAVGEVVVALIQNTSDALVLKLTLSLAWVLLILGYILFCLCNLSGKSHRPFSLYIAIIGVILTAILTLTTNVEVKTDLLSSKQFYDTVFHAAALLAVFKRGF